MKTKLKYGLAGAALLLATINVAHGDQTRNMTVYKTPWCGCCEVWTEAMQKAGFTVETKDVEELSSIKEKAGVPDELEACHTAVLGKYIIEGHVPLEAIAKLQREQPNIRGVAVAGMPTGSLGMGYDSEARYEVMSFTYSPTQKPGLFYEAGL